MKLGSFILGAVLAVAQVPAFGQTSNYAVAAPALAMSTPSTDDPNDGILTIRKRVDEVNVLFIATDKRGKFVRNLNQNDFSILDDNKPPADCSGINAGASTRRPI